MTLVAQKQAGRTGRPDRLQAHDDGRRYSGERGNEAGGEFRLSTPDCVEGEPRIAMSERFDIPEPGDVNVWYGEWLRKICAVAIQHDNPRYSCSARGIQSRKREPANNTIQPSWPMVKEASTRRDALEYTA